MVLVSLVNPLRGFSEALDGQMPLLFILQAIDFDVASVSTLNRHKLYELIETVEFVNSSRAMSDLCEFSGAAYRVRPRIHKEPPCHSNTSFALMSPFSSSR